MGHMAFLKKITREYQFESGAGHSIKICDGINVECLVKTIINNELYVFIESEVSEKIAKSQEHVALKLNEIHRRIFANKTLLKDIKVVFGEEFEVRDIALCFAPTSNFILNEPAGYFVSGFQAVSDERSEYRVTDRRGHPKSVIRQMHLDDHKIKWVLASRNFPQHSVTSPPNPGEILTLYFVMLRTILYVQSASDKHRSLNQREVAHILASVRELQTGIGKNDSSVDAILKTVRRNITSKNIDAIAEMFSISEALWENRHNFRKKSSLCPRK